MGKFSGVLIITDLDGTLLNTNKHVDAQSREAIKYFMANGGYFSFATGRMYQSFQNIRNRLIQNAPVIFSNGAQIYDLKNEKLLWECGLDSDIEPLCEEILKNFPSTAAEVYRHKKCDTLNENDITRKHIRDFEIERTIRSSFSEIEKPWIKVLFTGETTVLSEIVEFLNKRYKKANALFSTKNFLEVFSAKTDKGRGSLRLAKMLDVAPKNIYTVGDQENDIELLSAAQVSFAPENAVPDVKKLVDIILPDNDHNTIAAMISHIDRLY